MLTGIFRRFILFIALFALTANAPVSANPCNEVLNGSSATSLPIQIGHSQDIPWKELQPPALLNQIQTQFKQFKAAFSRIARSKSKPTFRNTVLAVEYASSKLNDSLNIYLWLKAGLNTPELKAIQAEVDALNTEFDSIVRTNTSFFERIKQLLPELKPGSEEYAVTHSLYQNMLREGVELPQAEKIEVVALQKKLAELSTRFGNNMQTFANDVGNLRVENEKIVIETVKLRDQLAKKLGYATYAHMTLSNRMIESPENLRRFYEDLVPELQRLKKTEDAAFKTFKQANPELKPAELLPAMKKALFNFDEKVASEYFEVNQTLKGTLEFIGDMFEVDIRLMEGVHGYLPEIPVYQITDRSTQEVLAEMHVDLYARETKRKGAWKSNFRTGGLGPKGREHSIMGIFLNLPAAEAGKPLLLQIEQVKTLLHELGHAMHDAFSKLKYKTLSGTQVKWDFVEFPSQLMENWLTTPEYLSRVAKHYQTGLPFPNELVSQISGERLFRIGDGTFRQARLGLIDFGWHASTDIHFDETCDFVCRFEKETFSEFSIVAPEDYTAFSPTFRHIFAGGYASGYYSYLYSKMIEQDGFSFWYENPEQIHEKAMRLRNEILSQGGFGDPKALYRSWRGKDYSPYAFFKKIGVIPAFLLGKMPKELPPPREINSN